MKGYDMKLVENLILEQIQAGPMENFSYFIGDAKTKEVALVDPAWELDGLCKRAEKNGYKITAVLLTHGHYDHSQGVEELLSYHNVPVYVSECETTFHLAGSKDVRYTKDKEKIKIGNIEIECLHTPGHTPGGQCFKCFDVLITGDTLFIDGCGRCDLPGSDVKAMFHSLFNCIKELPDSTIIYPGHDYGPVPYATLAEQKKTNPYLIAKDMDDFLLRRMGF